MSLIFQIRQSNNKKNNWKDPFLLPRGCAMWVLIWSCTSSGSLHHASAVSALLSFTTGTAPGEPIRIVRHAGDSCSHSKPHPLHPLPTTSLKAPHPWWKEYCRSSLDGVQMLINGSIRTAAGLKWLRHCPLTLDEWGVIQWSITSQTIPTDLVSVLKWVLISKDRSEQEE